MPEKKADANNPSESLPTKGDLTDQDHKPQHEEKHPEQYKQDLNPKGTGGQNIGAASSVPSRADRTAADIKEMYDRFPELNADALRQISIVDEGERLSQGATYADLAAEQPQEFTAMGDQEAGPDNLYAPKKDVPHEVWNHLIGDEKPGQEFEGSPNFETG